MCEGIVGDFCSTQTSHHEAIFLGAIETSLGGGLGGRGPRLSSLFRSRSSAASSGNHLGQLAPDDERARARTAGQTLKRRLDDIELRWGISEKKCCPESASSLPATPYCTLALTFKR